MSTCPFTDEAVAYALEQLTPREKAAFELHLDACSACRLKVREVADVSDLLPFSIQPVIPPPHLKERILEQVAVEQGLERKGRSRRWVLLGAAVAAVAIFLAGGYTLVGFQGWGGSRHATPQERAVVLVGTETAPAASGRVVLHQEGDATVITLQAQSLPGLQPGEAYQLWLIKDGKRTSAGVFVVDGAGDGGLATWISGVPEFDALGITREPDAYGSQPRGPKVLGSRT
ncbi:MAG: anti-sigma factor domain-containing protein [Bacillota bacterium]